MGIKSALCLRCDWMLIDFARLWTVVLAHLLSVGISSEQAKFEPKAGQG